MTASIPADSRSKIAWILIPAVVMSLGWGLRGYIGGGPFGAMIPGALVTLIICRYLGCNERSAANVVVFGAFGVGFGGLMTYGQTLGLLRADETLAWGLTGTTLKGGVWGLLGGAVIGLGLAARHIPQRKLGWAFLFLLAGVIVGIHEINATKLVYFSDPVNKPRDESWAGLLIGALALLGYVRLAAPNLFWIPGWFAVYGLVGGAIGFGAGSLFNATQSRVSDTWRWMPFWKYMEFSFGLAFGAALGLCALHLRDRLAALVNADDDDSQVQGVFDDNAESRGLALVAGVLLVYGVFAELRLFIEVVIPRLRDLPATNVGRTVVEAVMGFTGIGRLVLWLSTWWRNLAWQAAISVTITAAAIDWQRDLLPRGDIDMPEIWRTTYIVGMAGASILFVHVWQRRANPRLMSLFLFATCVLMAIGYQMGLGMSGIWWPNPDDVAAAGSRGAYLLQKFRSELIVHAIFTTLFVISVVAGVVERRREATSTST